MSHTGAVMGCGFGFGLAGTRASSSRARKEGRGVLVNWLMVVEPVVAVEDTRTRFVVLPAGNGGHKTGRG